MIFSNSETSARRPLVLTVSDNSWPAGAGDWPMRPTAYCAFCSLMARTTSPVVSFNCASRSGLSQMRMA